jgi:hypothetical protein
MKVLLKKLFYNSGLLILLLNQNLAQAQVNLLPNASFEDTIELSGIHGQLCLHNWQVLDSSR